MAAPVTPLWQNSLGKRLAVKFAYPLFLILNRPSFTWLAHAMYDFALRCNGVAINFPGRYGLTAGEEKFLACALRGMAGGVMLDVGANSGAYARHMHRLCPDAHIYAFEPHPRTFEILKDLVSGIPSITAVNLAVSDTPGLVHLYDFANNDGSTQASLSENTVKFFDNETVAHEVKVTTIDEFMVDKNITHIALLKIDTEGFDLAVLKGAHKALAARAIDVIQFEFIPADIAMHITMRDFFGVLDGYRLHRLCLNGALMPLHPYDVKRCEIYVTQNLVALPMR